MQQRPFQILSERRLPRDAPRLLETDRRRDDRLVGAALGRERDPGRRSDEDRLPAGVQAERPRLERPVDERVIQRADREQRLAVARPGQRRARRAARRGCPRRCRARCAGRGRTRASAPACRVSSANQSIRSPSCQTPARLIQPPRLVEEATSGLTVTTCAATSGAAWARSTKNRPNACWVDSAPECSRPRSTGAGRGRRGSIGSRRSRAAAVRHSSASGESSGNAAHGIGWVGAQLRRQLFPLRDRQAAPSGYPDGLRSRAAMP